jgi:hypothetical protein
MASTTTKPRTLPRDPRTVAEMIPVREDEIRARNAKPRCHIKGHGIMQPRPLAGQTYEQMWCGVWYDCTAFVGNQRCGSSASYSSRELAAYHGEPYVVDATHHEVWDGSGWQPVSEEEAAAYWAERSARYQMTPAQVKARGRRSRAVAKRA